MIINVDISLKELSEQGTAFKWIKPHACPKCSSPLWGHGHVLSNKLFLKKYRCNTCSTVITLKPNGYWKKYKTSIKEIYLDLRFRLTRFHWKSDVKRQRRDQWIKKFISFTMMHISCEHRYSGIPLIDLLDFLYSKSIPFLF